MVIRAPLFVPAYRKDLHTKAASSGADAVILDLEDAVADEDKEKARTGLDCQFTQLPVYIRINATDSPWHEDDLIALHKHQCAAIILPKTETSRQLDAIIDALGNDAQLIALIETARGLAAARDIAAHPNVVRLAFGSLDFCNDLNIKHLPEALLPARHEIVLASRLAGIDAPLDGVTTDFTSADAVQQDALHARDIGMGGKLCIHPSQPPLVQYAYLPSIQEVEWARAVLAAQPGASNCAGQMVDNPVRAQARRIIERSDHRQTSETE